MNGFNMGLVSNKAVQDKLLIIFVRWIFLLIHPSWSPSHRQALKEKGKVKLEKIICQCCQHSQQSPGSHLQDFTSHFAKTGVISVGKREGLDNITTSTTFSLIPTSLGMQQTPLLSHILHKSQSSFSLLSSVLKGTCGYQPKQSLWLYCYKLWQIQLVLVQLDSAVRFPLPKVSMPGMYHQLKEI